jgi:hypothetical protein
MAVPKTDARLAEFSTNFNTRGSADPAAFGLSVLQMAQYSALHEAWISAYRAAAGGAKSKALVAAKDQAKAALLVVARELYALIQCSPSVSEANKALMGVTVRKNEPTPRNAPELSPMLSLLSVTGRVGFYKISDRAAPMTRRRPANAEGAVILSYAGANPPAVGEPGWKLEAQTGRTSFQVRFANDIAPGTPCWVVARWYSRRGQYSPACDPVQTYLQIGPVAEAA